VRWVGGLALALHMQDVGVHDASEGARWGCFGSRAGTMGWLR